MMTVKEAAEQLISAYEADGFPFDDDEWSDDESAFSNGKNVKIRHIRALRLALTKAGGRENG